jgi:ATP-dependent RNA helicase DeaD
LNKFSQLGLSPSVLEVLEQLGFEQPTPIQEEAIPQLLTKDPTDFIGLAQTGTGKTAAFGLPLIDLVDSDNPTTQALVMAPTRELGQQTASQLVQFAKNQSKLNIEVVYGGAAIVNQIKALKRPTQIVVATPGRLLDLVKRKAIKLDSIRYVVLDEADEMLNMGFKEAIDEILSHIPEERAIWLFSATMPQDIRRITKKYMKDPIEVAVNADQKSNIDISHKYVITKASNKLAAMRRFLDIQPDMRGIMFCRTKIETQQIADQLSQAGYGVEAIHGDLSQAQRDAVMKRFKTRAMQLLIATDVAARGIDVNDLTHVINHSLPDQLESYTHRSGRTGRAGNKGTSIVFINPRETRKIQDIERKIKVQFERIEIPSFDEMKSSRIKHWANLIVNTKVDKNADTLLAELADEFAHLSKEDVLRRLITTQLDHLMVDGGEESNLNETAGGSPGRRETSGFNRYFINVGSIDGMTKGDLIHFISDVSQVDRKYFGDLNLKNNCAYFEVDGSQDQGLSERFEGKKMDGRDIRVNRDDEVQMERGVKRDKKRPRSGGGGGKFSGGGGSKYGGGKKDPRREFKRVSKRR